MNAERLLERFLQYVKIDTTAVEESGRYPSSDGQFELGKLLVQQLSEMGAADCLLYTSPSPRDKRQSRMPSSA